MFGPLTVSTYFFKLVSRFPALSHSPFTAFESTLWPNRNPSLYHYAKNRPQIRLFFFCIFFLLFCYDAELLLLTINSYEIMWWQRGSSVCPDGGGVKIGNIVTVVTLRYDHQTNITENKRSVYDLLAMCAVHECMRTVSIKGKLLKE